MTITDDNSHFDGTAHDPWAAESTSAHNAPPVPGGPRWQRRRIRRLGPFAALIVPGIVGAIAYLSLQLFDSASSGAVGLVGGVMSAPGLLAVGAPFADRSLYPLAVLASGVIWLLLGAVAAQRATRHPFPSWSDFWRHFLVMMIGVWVGAAVTLAIVTVRLGESLF